jgi:hypothetical protein
VDGDADFVFEGCVALPTAATLAWAPGLQRELCFGCSESEREACRVHASKVKARG